MDAVDNRVVKASFRDCSLEDRKLFSRSKCLMPISVGQQVHEGKKFLATINLINKQFQSCTLLIDDSVQRHTLKIWDSVSTDEMLYKQAIQEGDAWLKRNEEVYNTLEIPFNILRWDQWLNHPAYQKQRDIVENIYLSDQSYQDAIHANAEEFLSRNDDKNSSSFDYQRAFTLCVGYLKEECAAMCLWVEGNYAFEVYPTGRNLAMAATYAKIIKPAYPDLLKSVALRFKKYPGLSLFGQPENYMEDDLKLNFVVK